MSNQQKSKKEQFLRPKKNEDDLKYIFERLYRSDKSRNRNTGGAGIGLAIVKSIVEAHNGTIEVESEVQKGSTFIVKIPIIKNI